MMRLRLSEQMLPSLLVVFAILSPAADARGQEPRNRPSRRTTNPVRQPAPVPTPDANVSEGARTQSPSDPTLISTADEQGNTREGGNTGATRRSSTSRTRRSGGAAAAETENEALRRTVNRLSQQFDSLAEDLNQLKDQQRTLVDMERLTRAEQRAEGFRAQLRDVLEKEMALQARSEQLDYELEPDSIQRRAALSGTFRPDELRETIRRQLESEKRRVEQQLNLLTTSRTRLENAISSADLEVDRLRARMEAAERAADEAGTTVTNSASPTTTTTTTRSTTSEPVPQTEPAVEDTPR